MSRKFARLDGVRWRQGSETLVGWIRDFEGDKAIIPATSGLKDHRIALHRLELIEKGPLPSPRELTPAGVAFVLGALREAAPEALDRALRFAAEEDGGRVPLIDWTLGDR
jgi:hypothetical protein